jgi:hypothetical protein
MKNSIQLRQDNHLIIAISSFSRSSTPTSTVYTLFGIIFAAISGDANLPDSSHLSSDHCFTGYVVSPVDHKNR